MLKPFLFGIASMAMIMALGSGGQAMAQMLGNGQFGAYPTAPRNNEEPNGGGPGPGTTENGGMGANAGLPGTATAPSSGVINNGGYAPSLGNFSPSIGNFGPGPNGYAPSLGNFGPGSSAGMQQ